MIHECVSVGCIFFFFFFLNFRVPGKMYCRISTTCVPYLLTVTVMEQFMRHLNPCRLCIWFLGAFTELRKAASSFMSVRPPSCLSTWTSFSSGRISHSKKNWARCDKKCTRYSCHILIKLEISRQILEKCSDIKFRENPSSGSRVIPMLTDRHDEANSRFS